MTSINIKIQKKDLFLLSAIAVFLIAVGFVVAYNAAYSEGNTVTKASVMGHSGDELEVECVTLKLVDNGYNVSLPSNLGKTYNFDEVGIMNITGTDGGILYPRITCRPENGWIMTGCIGQAKGLTDADGYMGSNGCRGDAEDGVSNRIHVRCCKFGVAA